MATRATYTVFCAIFVNETNVGCHFHIVVP